MKRFLKIIFVVCLFLIILSGCGIKNADNILKKVKNKQEDANSYYAKGVMEIVNNENTYTYNVEVAYKKKDYYKIGLINTLNNHEQVILRNDDGVYVVTPSLNKSFKFQSDWPYNNSQVYLLNSIVEDLSEDDNRIFKTKDNGYFFTSSVNYPNNKSLVRQNVYIDKNMKITKVEVTDKSGKVQITMKFNKIIYNKKFANDYFELSKLIKINDNKNNKDNSNYNQSKTINPSDNNSNNSNNATNNNDTTNNITNSGDSADSNNVTNNATNSGSTTNSNDITNDNNTTASSNDNPNSSSNTNTTNNNTNTNNNQEKQTASISDVIYPMYLPSNTTLANKEVVNTNDGERLILTFSGDNPFVLVEETLSYNDEGLIIPVSGNLDFLNDVIGVINDNSVTFESNGIGYYIVSDKLEKTELVNIARSISVLPVSK